MNIELRDVVVTLQSHEILKGLQLTHEGAGITVIQGPNASGKSTLLQCIAGLMPPTSGVVTTEGGTLGYVEQRPVFIESMSCYDNLLAAAAARGCTKSEASKQALALLADAGMSHLRMRPCSTLAHSERMLLSLVRGFIGDTNVVVADEPLAGLDEPLLRTTVDTLVRLVGTERSLVISTSSTSLASLFMNARVYELRDGVLTDISNLPSTDKVESNGEEL